MADGVTINQGTNTIVASDDVSGTQYQVIKLDMGTNGVSNPFSGTIPAVSNLEAGTITSLQGGTVSSNILSGSITVIASTITVLPNIPGGTIGLVTRVGNVGTLEVGTISTLPNIPGGTIGVVSSVTDVANLAKGTITRLEGGTVSSNILSGSIAVIAGTVESVGTVPGIGVVTNLTSGSVTMTVGTLTVMPNIPGGTLGLVTTVTNLSNGTIQSSGTTTGVGVVTSVTNLASGTLLNSGTTTGVGVVSLLSAGTVTRLEQGSINVTAGTFRQDYRPISPELTYGTIFGGTAAGYGTLIAAQGSGTSIYITNLKMMNNSGGTAPLDMMIGYGTALNGTTVVDRGNYVTGISRSFKGMNGNITNTDLVCYVGAAGTIAVNISYWIQ